MKYRKLGNTGLEVSEIGLGGEWLERHNTEEVKQVIDACEAKGINILDCWMCEPNVRSNIGKAIHNRRDHWIIQGHIGSTWQNGQYVRTRNLEQVKVAFQDLLDRFQTNYIDLGMIHFVDEVSEYEQIMNGEFIKYVQQLKEDGVIHHIGLSTHNPFVGKMAAESGIVELILFSLNPAFDLLPGSEDINTLFAEQYDEQLHQVAPERVAFYNACEENGVAITVMKGYGGGRLFNAEMSPFGIALTPVQCLHYALTRPAVASVMVGYDTPEHVEEACSYETATDEEKDYAKVLANAPKHAFSKGQCTYCGHCKPCPSGIDIAMVNKLYDLATMQASTPPTLKAHYEALEKHASDCIQCGSCEQRCPFDVKIVDKMIMAKKLFK